VKAKCRTSTCSVWRL